MASIKIKFRPSSVRGKEGVLFLQIIHRRVVRQIVTPYRLHAHEWDAFSQQVLLDAPSTQDPRWMHLARIDTMIQSEYRLLCRIVTSFDQTSANYSADSVVNEYHRLSKDLTLCATMQRLIAQMRINQQWCTAHNYQSTLNSLMRFRHQFDLPIDRLDVALIQSYEAWLKHRGICRNTISFYMRILAPSITVPSPTASSPSSTPSAPPTPASTRPASAPSISPSSKPSKRPTSPPIPPWNWPATSSSCPSTSVAPPSSISPTSARATSAKVSSATPEVRRDRR